MTEEFKKELIDIARGKAPIDYKAINEAAEGIALYLCAHQGMDEAAEEAWESLTEQERYDLLTEEIVINSEDEEWQQEYPQEEWDKQWEELKKKAAAMIKNHQQTKKSDFIKNHFIIC